MASFAYVISKSDRSVPDFVTSIEGKIHAVSCFALFDDLSHSRVILAPFTYIGGLEEGRSSVLMLDFLKRIDEVVFED